MKAKRKEKDGRGRTKDGRKEIEGEKERWRKGGRERGKKRKVWYFECNWSLKVNRRW